MNISTISTTSSLLLTALALCCSCSASSSDPELLVEQRMPADDVPDEQGLEAELGLLAEHEGNDVVSAPVRSHPDPQGDAAIAEQREGSCVQHQLEGEGTQALAEQPAAGVVDPRFRVAVDVQQAMRDRLVEVSDEDLAAVRSASADRIAAQRAYLDASEQLAAQYVGDPTGLASARAQLKAEILEG